ncbi:MAG TPA: ATP-binding protein [Acidobacteriaceae bacterium]|nr:ATP-binding protein [Acidobacteriaceae bacterium]
MRGLFTKIFLGFWIAQSLTFVISTVLVLQHRNPTGRAQYLDLQDTALNAEASAAADIYERAGCTGVANYGASIEQTIYLAGPSGNLLCDASNADVRAALADAASSSAVTQTVAGSKYLWTHPTHSASGKPYFLVLSRPYFPNTTSWIDEFHWFTRLQLPVAIVVFGITTFFLVLLLTQPIAKLRAGVRDLSRGRLETRVKQKRSLFGGDEMEGLVHDFNHMAERLESLVSAQKLLLRDVSHELRSPLARLSVALELAREEAPPSMNDQLQRIERETGRLNLLIGDLLRLSSMEAADAAFEKEEFSLNALLEELLPDAEFEAAQRSCKIEVHSTSPCVVRGNPELIYRAMENVLRNAIRYTPEGSVVQIDLGCGEQGGERTAVLEVSDQGPGIPETEINNIFLPFYRVDSARQRDTGGFGVGLALTQRAVRLHYGDVQAHNRPGGGLTVILKIPCLRTQTPRPTPLAFPGRHAS